MAGSKGDIILLVGPSCAGKSTLAKAIQDQSPKPFVCLSLDGLFAATPPNWASAGAQTQEGFRYAWDVADQGAAANVRRIAYGPVGWTLLQGFHRSVAAYAGAGANVVVDDMLLDQDVLADWALALEGLPVLLVSVIAPKDELLRREQARQARATPGLVAGHLALHLGVAADLVIDTSELSPTEAARRVLAAASG